MSGTLRDWTEVIPPDDKIKTVMLSLRLSNRGTALSERFRTDNVFLFCTQRDLARVFTEDCMIGATTLDDKRVLYIGAIARGTPFAKLVDDKFGKYRRKIFEKIYIDKIELNARPIRLDEWAEQYGVPIHDPTTIIAREERDREERERLFDERRAARRAAEDRF